MAAGQRQDGNISQEQAGPNFAQKIRYSVKDGWSPVSLSVVPRSPSSTGSFLSVELLKKSLVMYAPKTR